MLKKEGNEEMKVKYGEIVAANEPIALLAREKVSVKEAVGIARIVKVLGEEFAIYQAKQKELLDKYGTPTENGRYKFNDSESAMKFNADYDELLDYEAELAIEPVKLVSDIKIDAETIIRIEKFIDFE